MRYTKIFSREYSVQYVEAYIKGISKNYKRFLPAIVEGFIVLPEDGNQANYVPKKAWDDYINAVKKWGTNPIMLKKFLKQFHKAGRMYVSVAKQIGRQNFTALQPQTLIKLYEKYLHVLEYYSAFLWTSNYLGEYLGEIGEDLFAKKGFNSALSVKIHKSLFQPARKTGILLLQEKLRDRKNLSGPHLKGLSRQFAWVPCMDLHNQPWGPRDLLKFYSGLPKTEKILSYSTALKLAKLDEKEKKLLKIIREFMYVKDERDVYRRQGVHAILPLFEAIGRRLKLSREETAFCSKKEIISALKNQRVFPKPLANARMKGFLYFGAPDNPKISINKLILDQLAKKVSIGSRAVQGLKGVIASQGRATGRVKKVLGLKDLSKVKKGSILVAITTHPDFVPAMQKALAIVTDEGGITSHAAIVSRELNIPCIVGTKIATKIFKDGDLVEVDANKGTAKKL